MCCAIVVRSVLVTSTAASDAKQASRGILPIVFPRNTYPGIYGSSAMGTADDVGVLSIYFSVIVLTFGNSDGAKLTKAKIGEQRINM